MARTHVFPPCAEPLGATLLPRRLCASTERSTSSRLTTRPPPRTPLQGTSLMMTMSPLSASAPQLRLLLLQHLRYVLTACVCLSATLHFYSFSGEQSSPAAPTADTATKAVATADAQVLAEKLARAKAKYKKEKERCVCSLAERERDWL